jgi:hypothetical protein
MDNTPTQPGDISTDEISRLLEQQLARFDPQRAQALSGLAGLRAARDTGYAREQQRLTLKYGANSPQVLALADKQSVNAGLRRDLAFETARAQTPAPSVAADDYVFHGFVRDAQGQGAAGLTVALYDANGNWLRELSYSCTDARGYFLLRLKHDAANDPAAPKDSSKVSGDNVSQAIATQAVAYIYLRDASGRVLQVEKEPLHPQLGQIDFRIILLGGDAMTCSPPLATSTPLEKIRGIGPVRARQLRAAGIADVESLLRTDVAKLVRLVGGDANAFQRQAAQLVKAKAGPRPKKE